MNNQSVLTPRLVLQLVLFVIVVPFLPLLIAGRWDWWEGWTYALVGVLGFIASRALAARRHPDLLAERARMLKHDDAETWDKWLAPLVALGGGLIPLVAGLNARLDPSTAYGLPLRIVALILILGGYALGAYALMANRYFSGMVRIQSERDHHVISSGPYRWVRHPGYAGALLTYLATPLFLETPWAFVPALLWSLVLFTRTALEDRTLQRRLEGYGDYAARVPYRLLPGVWLLLLVPLFILLPGCAGEEEASPASEQENLVSIELSSPAFPQGEAIPARYTCDGDDVSPPLQWQDVPAEAQSLALIVDDPDAPRGTWVHWLLYDIPPQTRELPADIAPATSLPGGGSQGNNSWNRLGYGGPCPPGGASHRYFFKLYALDMPLDLASEVTEDQLLAAMEGHILAQGELMGTYARQ